MICPACQAPNDDASETCIHCGRGLYALTLGTRLAGRYEIAGVLGRGGMGVVYLARDRELDETVALKVLRADIAGSEEAARRFRSEIKLARRIRHRNVCGIHEYGIHEYAPDHRLVFIVMEYVEGSTLRQVLRHPGIVRRIRRVAPREAHPHPVDHERVAARTQRRQPLLRRRL